MHYWRMPKPGARWRYLVFVASGIALALSTVFAWLYFSDDPDDRLEFADHRAGVVSMLLTAIGLLIATVGIRQGHRPPPFEHRRLLTEATAELAELVSRQWSHEARIRGLTRPEPIRVRWASTGLPVGASAAEVLGPDWTAGRPTRLKLHGDVTRVAAALRRLPARRLVVIGPPGAGKTSLAVLLVRELLGAREPAEAVPVLLSLSMWPPEEQNLAEWMVGQINRAYPPLASEEHFGPEAVSRMLSAGLILPVLDGLDEVSRDHITLAVTRLNNYLSQDRPIVVTCRTAEYQEIIGQVGAVLARAAVVELESVSHSEAAAYLPAGQGEAGRRRWKPVTRHLLTHPDGPLAQVFSTPLMVHLARVVYRGATEPADLLRFTDPATLEDHLLRNYVPALYAEQEGAPAARPGYRPEQAQRWLAFLAAHMSRARTREISWWQLVNATSLSIGRYVVAGIVVVAVLGHVLFNTAIDFWTAGATLGLTVVLGPIVGIVMSLADGQPCRVRLRPRSFFEGFAIGGSFALCGAPFLLLMMLFTETLPLGASLFLLAAFCLMGGLMVGTIAFLVGGIGATVGTNRPTGSRTSLRDDRNAFLVTTTAAFLAVGLIWYGMLAGLGPWMLGGWGGTAAASALMALALGPVIGLTSGAGAAWLRFTYARVWLTVHGLAPWRVLDFLDDAHDRGVLRKIDAAYQFRHARLQTSLATTGPLVQPATVTQPGPGESAVASAPAG
ncbi:hypothetical protein Aca07nite_81310 [Actinoplanes capillaceus]|uniref:NACHT domain-containing protein n=2 Tax=Actinoplanes campanulatus TaxID=113559 RepID=A0ABQ3WX49_9ACTN|nr:hypothetical protein Aca07nite_81310 [Actinoplanes capillaceus]